MFGISGFELLIIAAFVLIVFGPDKLPELARVAGRAIRMFKSAQEDMERVVKAEMFAEKAGPFEQMPSKPAAATTTETESAASSASAVWAATSEDEDEEEEDEE